MKLYFHLFLVGITLALLYPALAPLVDHHAAERHPSHVHLYAGGVPISHDHFLETHHSHGHQGSGLPWSLEAGPDGNIVILPADETGAIGSVVVAVSALLTTLIALVFAQLLIKAVNTQQWALRGNIPLLDPPPPRFSV